MFAVQIGIYFGNYSDYSFAKKLKFADGVDVFSYSTVDNEPNEGIPFAFIPDCAELLAGSDALLVFAGQSACYSITVDAIRRGIHVLHSDLSLISLQNLIDMRNLLQEIDVNVNFGCSGFNVLNYLSIYKPIENAIFVDCKRNVQRTNSQLQLRKVLTFDLATLLRLTKSAVRKVRIGVFPILENSFNLLNLRLELDNGSIYCYTLTNNLEAESYLLTPYIDNQTHLACYSSNEPFDSFAQSIFADSMQHFVAGGNNSSPQFNIERAIDLRRLLQEVFEKLNF
jgi:hypothetical protein